MNVAFARLALPAKPTEPTSPSNQPEAKSDAAITVTGTVVKFVRLPEVPVTVTFAVPVVAVLAAVRIKTLELVTGFALSQAVTPLGNPEMDKLTLPVNPFCADTKIVLASLPPWGMPKLLCINETVKFGPAFTVSESTVVLIRPPTEPVMVRGNVPVVALFVAVNVRLLEDVAGFWLKLAVTPLGKPETDKLTPLVKPFCAVTLIVLVPLAP